LHSKGEVLIMKKLNRFQFIAGFVLGAMIFGGSAAYAAGVIANLSADRVYVNGSEIKCDVYKIGGANHFKLRDIAANLDVSVVYDAQSGRVLIDTAKPYDPNEQYVPGPVMTMDEMRQEIVNLTNAERVKAGVPELAVLPELMDCSQTKAQDFKDSHYYGHTSPVYGSFSDMIRSFVPQARAVGENIAPWNKTAADAFAAWTDSPPHLENLLNQKYTHIGVGVIEGINGGYWWVSQFAQCP
jgi:uncharacterized protein YkwD